MKTQTIGTELEFTGISRETAAKVIANFFGTTAQLDRSWTATDNAGREWKVVSDGSIRTENGGEACEMVTPILGWADIENLQEIVRGLRRAGAKVNETCGLHIHIGAQGMTAAAIRNLVNNVASHEKLLYKALDVHEYRKRYCRPTDERFLRELNEKKPATLDELKPIWYGDDGSHNYHYDNSRYTVCNLHATFTKGTIEMRLFNGSLHAGEIKTAIQLCCAMVAFAKTSKHTLYRPVQNENEKFAMRTWLIRMGMSGDEFKTARHHLTKKLTGNAAWRFAC